LSYCITQGLHFLEKGEVREEYRLKVLRRIFGPKRDEVTGEW
jgi:hypothetical protein